MKIYIATRFERREEVSKLFQILKENGHEVSGDWTTHKPIKPFFEENKELSEEYSIEDIEAVKDSDVFILLSDAGGTGMYVELGVAILSNINLGRPKIYIVGEHNTRNMFFFHPSVNRKKDINDVIKEISKLNKQE